MFPSIKYCAYGKQRDWFKVLLCWEYCYWYSGACYSLLHWRSGSMNMNISGHSWKIWESEFYNIFWLQVMTWFLILTKFIMWMLGHWQENNGTLRIAMNMNDDRFRWIWVSWHPYKSLMPFLPADTVPPVSEEVASHSMRVL